MLRKAASSLGKQEACESSGVFLTEHVGLPSSLQQVGS